MTNNNSHTPDAPFTQNQNNSMSEDPDDGQRNAFKPGKDGTTPVEKAPEHDVQDQEDIEAFGARGAAQGSE